MSLLNSLGAVVTANSVQPTGTLVAQDEGTDGAANTYNTDSGTGIYNGNNGTFGVTWDSRRYAWDALGNTIRATYGASTADRAITAFAASGTGLASADKTDVLVTAAGMSATDSLIKTDDVSSRTWTLPTTTKTATVKFTVQTSAGAPAGGALITVTPSWSGTYGTSLVSPAPSSTGTVYTTDALGNFSVTVTNSSPVNAASVSLVLSGGAAFGAATHTAVLTWATPAAASIVVADPIAGLHVLTGSTNVVTVLVRDQFGTPVSGQLVSVSTAQTPTVAATVPATVIAPITTGDAGTATYSFTPAAASTSANVTFNCVPVACGSNAVHAFTYKATLPVVATLTGSFGRTWGTASTLVPATGIYNESGTAFVLEDARNISRTLNTAGLDANTTNDEIALSFAGLTAAGVVATGATVTVTAGAGGHIVHPSTGLPVKSHTFAIGSASTGAINVLATGTGAITFTATSGAVTATASMWVAGRVNTDNSNTAARFVTVTSAKTGAANSTGTPVTVSVTDRYGNPVSGVDLNVVASGVGSFMGGGLTSSFKTDASGSYTFLANTTVAAGGVAKFTATTGTAGSFESLAGYVGATEVDATLAAGNSSASTEITFEAGVSATDAAIAALKAQLDAAAVKAAADKASSDAAIAAAQAAAVAAAKAAEDAATASADAAAEATDAANAATDAANASAEAGDAATAAAQDAADAVAALSTQVSEMIDTLKKQITALTNLVIKIQKKVKA